MTPPAAVDSTGVSDVGATSCCWMSWWLAAGALTLVIALLAAMLPARARLIGLFGLIEGALVGGLLAEVLRRRHGTPGRCVLGVALLCGSTAFGLSSLLWWREFAHSVREEYRIPPPQLLALQMKSQSPTSDSQGFQTLSELQSLRQRFEADPQRTQELESRCSLPGYLVFRLYGVANAARISHRQSVAVAVWMSELVAAGIASLCMVRRQARLSTRLETPATSTAVGLGVDEEKSRASELS